MAGTRAFTLQVESGRTKPSLKDFCDFGFYEAPENKAGTKRHEKPLWTPRVARGKVLFRQHNPHQRGDHIMPQTLAPFHLEHTTSTGTVTARGGAALLLEAFYATGLHEASRSIRRRPNRGYDDADHVMTVILLNLLGLASCDDVRAPSGRQGPRRPLRQHEGPPWQ